MNDYQKRIGRARFEGIEKCWILVSAQRRESDRLVLCEPHMSFLYDNGEGMAAEWEPKHGPIQVWHRCGEDDEKAREHYWFDFVNDGHLNFLQLAVEKNGLPQAFLDGRYRHIFSVLQRWTTHGG